VWVNPPEEYAFSSSTAQDATPRLDGVVLDAPRSVRDRKDYVTHEDGLVKVSVFELSPSRRPVVATPKWAWTRGAKPSSA
jgi:hypothetical protein